MEIYLSLKTIDEILLYSQIGQKKYDPFSTDISNFWLNK